MVTIIRTHNTTWRLSRHFFLMSDYGVTATYGLSLKPNKNLIIWRDACVDEQRHPSDTNLKIER